MKYCVAKDAKTGLYWGGGAGGVGESFSVANATDAVAFGDAHRDPSDLPDDADVVWVEITQDEDD